MGLAGAMMSSSERTDRCPARKRPKLKPKPDHKDNSAARFAFLLWRREMIIKRTRHHRGVAIAAFIIVAAATLALETYAGINWSAKYSGFTAGL